MGGSLSGLIPLLAVAASLVFLARLLPQPLRTFRTGEVAGVSCLAAMNALVADAAWLLYGLTAGVLAVWLVSVPAVVLSGWTVLLLRRTIGWRSAAIASGWLGLIVACAVGGALPLALSLTVLVCCGPAVWSAFSTRSPVGLSRWTWWLAVADAATWGCYGLAIGDGALQMYGAVLMVTAGSVLMRLRSVGVAAAAAPPAGLEPATLCLEGNCSIRLSYGGIDESLGDGIRGPGFSPTRGRAPLR